MVEQRRKEPGRSSGAALGRGRGRRPTRARANAKTTPAKSAKTGRPSRRTRTRRSASHGPRTVMPSNRWRPMQRVGGGPSGSTEQPSPSERPTQQAEQQTEQTPPRHGILGRLFQRGS